MGRRQRTKAEAWYVTTKSEHLLAQSNTVVLCAIPYMYVDMYVCMSSSSSSFRFHISVCICVYLCVCVCCSLKHIQYAPYTHLYIYVHILEKLKTRLLLTPSASSILFVAVRCSRIWLSSAYGQRAFDIYIYEHRQTRPPLLRCSIRFGNVCSQNVVLTKRFTVRKKPPALFVLFLFYTWIIIRFTCARLRSVSLSLSLSLA